MNFQINPNYDLFIIIFLITIFVLYHAYQKFFTRREYFVLLILRSLSIIFLMLLIFDPSIEKKGKDKKSMPWHIYIDKSLSIKYHKQPSARSYKNGIKNFLKMIKDKKINFDVFSFGSSIDSIKNLSELNLNANSTNMGLIFDKINSDYQKKLGGVIIFTDGQVNQGPPIQEFYNFSSEIPIYVIGIGETTPMLDVFVKTVNSPPLSVKGENVNIDVVISSIGDINERVNVNLFDETNKLIGSKLISVSGQEENQIIHFQVNPDKIGENIFYVKCSALSDEINIQNNQQKITLYVMKDQYNIALVTGSPNYNTRLIKNYLIEQGNNNIDHFVMSSKTFNQKIKKFLEKKYEVIIFDNNPVKSNSQKWESVARVFAKKIISHNSSFFIIPGPEINVNTLNKYLKIIDMEAEKIDESLQIPLNWRFLNSWSELHSFDDNKKLFDKYDSYPPLKPAFKLQDEADDKLNTPYAKYTSDEFGNPLLVLGEKQQIRYALWNSINLYSLKYMLSNSDLNFLFDNSMRKITNWLMKKSDIRDFVFRTDKNSYQHGELVLLKGVSSDLNDNMKINDGFVELYYDNQYITSKPLLFDLNDKIYKSEFWAPKPGKIEYVIKVNRGLESYKVNSGFFMVQESHIELNKIFLHEDKLINLSTSTNGHFIKWKFRDEIIPFINNIKKIESYVSLFTFRFNYFYICFIILLLSTEWLYRKRNGFI